MITTRSLAAAVAVLGLLGATACGTDDTADGNGAEGTPAAQATVDTPPGGDPAQDDGPAQDGTGPTIAFTEVEANNSPDSCWAVIDDTVYDLTGWIDQHPGGADRIEMLCGTDATDQFMQQHGDNERPQSQVREFEIGTVEY